MATIYKTLSKKTDATQKAQILLRVRNGKDYDFNLKSGLFVTADNFNTKSGEIVINRRKLGNDIEYHKEVKKRLDDLCTRILDTINDNAKTSIDKKLLEGVIAAFHNIQEESGVKSFSVISEEFIAEKQISSSHVKDIRCAARVALRFEMFKRETENKAFSFSVDKVTKDDIEDLISYFKNESALQSEYPEIFKRILAAYPNGKGKIGNKIQQRSNNTLVKKMEQIRSIFNFAVEKEYIKENPFNGINLGKESYKTEPIYLTLEERDTIASADLQSLCKNNKTHVHELELQKDIFIFQCYVGCRVSDLMRFTPDNITANKGIQILAYTPQKTANETEIHARVPLHPKALALIEKYKGVDLKGRLFPCISAQKYNKDLKRIFSICEITRKVEVINPKTGEIEFKPLNEIASSHLARRTFIANLYTKVQDPTLIGKMSGHIEGSKAFTRYRKIEDETLNGVINLI